MVARDRAYAWKRGCTTVVASDIHELASLFRIRDRDLVRFVERSGSLFKKKKKGKKKVVFT